MTKCDITVPILHHADHDDTHSHHHYDFDGTSEQNTGTPTGGTPTGGTPTGGTPTGMYVKVTVALVRDDPLPQELFHTHEIPSHNREIPREPGLARPASATHDTPTRAKRAGESTNRATFCYETSQNPRPTQFIDRHPSKVITPNLSRITSPIVN